MNVQCHRCKQDVEVPATEQQLANWRAGELIQRAMPNLTADEREILISGYCGKCFDEITLEPEYDEGQDEIEGL